MPIPPTRYLHCPRLLSRRSSPTRISAPFSMVIRFLPPGCGFFRFAKKLRCRSRFPTPVPPFRSFSWTERAPPCQPGLWRHWFPRCGSDDQRRQSLRAKDDQFHGDHLELAPAKQRDAVQLCGATLRARNTAGWQHVLFPFRKVQHCSDVHDPAHHATGGPDFCPVGDCASRWAGERRV